MVKVRLLGLLTTVLSKRQLAEIRSRMLRGAAEGWASAVHGSHNYRLSTRKAVSVDSVSSHRALELKPMEFYDYESDCPPPHSPGRLSHSGLPLYLNASARDVAEELTHIELYYYYQIKYEDFLPSENTAASLQSSAGHYNRVASWVASTIVMLYDNESRAHLVAFHRFARIARKLCQMKNYNTASAIIAGMNNIAVQRLRAIKDQPGDTFNKIEKMLSARDNYFKYRERAAKDFDLIVVPFIAVALKDLTFINDGNEDFKDTEKTQINFEKWRLIARTVYDVAPPDQAERRKLSEDSLRFSVREEITHCQLGEEELYQRSLHHEPSRAARLSRVSSLSYQRSSVRKESPIASCEEQELPKEEEDEDVDEEASFAIGIIVDEDDTPLEKDHPLYEKFQAKIADTEAWISVMERQIESSMSMSHTTAVDDGVRTQSVELESELSIKKEFLQALREDFALLQDDELINE